MSKKRTTTEADDDEGTKEDSDSLLHLEDNAKRAKLILLSDKTLEDIPIRLLERILVKTVVTEVRSMKLAKSVWEEKAVLVISRLTTVCLLWSSILTTNRFLTEVHRILDGIAQETIRFEILHQSRIQHSPLRLAIMNEEIYILCKTDDASDLSLNVRVYDRNNLSEVKDVIALPEKNLMEIEGCDVSNCVYVLCYAEELNENSCSVLRIKRDEENRFNVVPWITDQRKVHSISVLPNGILSVTQCRPVGLRNFDANGSLVLSADIQGFDRVDRVIQNSNGNLVLAFIGLHKIVLTEISTDGKVLRQYLSSPQFTVGSVHFVDAYDRILVADKYGTSIHLLDSELNRLDFASEALFQRNYRSSCYDSQKNEIVSSWYGFSEANFITTFRLIEE